ncbi:PREDICTED: uncharacterized protein LOC109584862 [Amphimedon queenslandica]|uniref:CARD domain-containing protein n=1 Tax=Amphimedon queenslandica TaxID=400682 RepID=A0A1X7U3X9_AMPQE|nr:PREDICTED: uncharacterized protein LOC109584862 [Amphimedon queenslandica]|eukprot:XP_019856316.1 PREDICTED: uncharacterized protein LOC109584862 [Amphimedon queenslandica]
MSTSPLPSVPVEILHDLEPSLQDLLNLSVLAQSFEGRPVLAPLVPDIKESTTSSTQRVECIKRIIEYVTRTGNLAMTAFLGALKSTSESCEGHHRALMLFEDASTDKPSTEQSELMNILQENAKELEQLDIILLLPSLLQKSVINNDNYRDLKGTYMSHSERAKKLLTFLQTRGADGIVEFLMTLQTSSEENHNKIGGRLISKVQDLVQSKRTGDIDKTLLLKLGKLGVNMSAVSRSHSSSSEEAQAPAGPHDRVAVLVRMSEYFEMSSKRSQEVKLSNDESIVNWLREQDYHIIDITFDLINKCQSGEYKDYHQVLIEIFDKEVASCCHPKTIIIVYLTGLAYMTKASKKTCLLMDRSHFLSRSQDDCITDSHIKIGLKQLPTPYVTIISDTLWSKEEKEEKAPWGNLCSWDSRTVVISSTIEYEDQKSIPIERELMKYLESSLRSWSDDRECPKISHYQFYQSLVHGYRDSEDLPLTIVGDVDRILFGYYNYPYPLFLFGRLLREEGKIECGCGYYVMGLEPEQEVTVSLPTQPEGIHKAVVHEVTDNTCIVKYNVVTNIPTDVVHLFVTVPDREKILISTDINDRMKDDILVSYLNQSSRLDHTKATGQLKVKQVFEEFEITDQTDSLQSPKVIVSSIELVKSLLERIGHYLLVRNWKNVVQRSRKNHKCFLNNFKTVQLDPRGFQVSSNSEIPNSPAEYALHDDDKYWKPASLPAELRIEIKKSYYVTAVELTTTPQMAPNASRLPRVEMSYTNKIPLVKSRYEGPSVSHKTLMIPLISIDDCKQRQDHSTFSVIKISPLKLDQSVDRGMFVFNLVIASTDNEVNYVQDYTILDPMPSIQCIPVPNADQQVKLENNGEPLIVSFTNTYDSILLAIDGNAPVTCSQLMVYYPENGKPIELFDIELIQQSFSRSKELLNAFHPASGISRTDLKSPKILHELILHINERYPLQVHLYGSSMSETMVGKVDSNLELSLNNESPQVLFVTVMCIEKTGKIDCIVSQKDIAPMSISKDTFINLSLPEGESSTVDTYRVFVSCSPLQLDSLQQLNVMDYFSSHKYKPPNLKNLILQEKDEEWYCYQYTVRVIK